MLPIKEEGRIRKWLILLLTKYFGSHTRNNFNSPYIYWRGFSLFFFQLAFHSEFNPTQKLVKQRQTTGETAIKLLQLRTLQWHVIFNFNFMASCASWVLVSSGLQLPFHITDNWNNIWSQSCICCFILSTV